MKKKRTAAEIATFRKDMQFQVETAKRRHTCHVKRAYDIYRTLVDKPRPYSSFALHSRKVDYSNDHYLAAWRTLNQQPDTKRARP